MRGEHKKYQVEESEQAVKQGSDNRGSAWSSAEYSSFQKQYIKNAARPRTHARQWRGADQEVRARGTHPHGMFR